MQKAPGGGAFCGRWGWRPPRRSRACYQPNHDEEDEDVKNPAEKVQQWLKLDSLMKNADPDIGLAPLFRVPGI